MNKKIATSLQRKSKLVLSLCLLLGALGALTIVYTQKAQRQLTLRDAVIKENARTLRAREGFRFEKNADKKISVVEIKTRRRVVMGDGICGGGCSACSALLDMDGKTRCLGCNANPDCKLSSAF
jgi:cell division protein FtsL